MNVIFPYETVGESPFGKIYRPVAKVTFTSLEEAKNVDIWMIVDTGADYTIVPRHFAQKLRISLERDCVKDTTFGVGGEQAIYFLKKKITAEIGNVKKEVPLAFFDSNEVPALLGRLGFMEIFDVKFLKNHTVVFND